MTGPHVDDGHVWVALGLLVVCVIPHFYAMWRDGFWRSE